ncbi:hypothetical protein SAMN04487910_3826 [Aquimarina amphilecti]|uniref:Uncharacterized protein n=2 Tax=Aquimarina amphilecti TaxID=1038014 RepID=A0A1H7UQL2_AQUAM|nr:hypothetical protein SAMN04487910_3826 [Aquimarina amphilecti]
MCNYNGLGIMKTQEYFIKKIDQLRDELYSEINEFASLYRKYDDKRLIYPKTDSEIMFCNATSEKFESHKIQDVLIDKKRICIYPKSDTFLPYDLMDIINIYDLIILRSVLEKDRSRQGVYLEIRQLIYNQKFSVNVNNEEIQFFLKSSEACAFDKIKNIIINEFEVFIYPQSSEFDPFSLSNVISENDLKVLKIIIEKELKQNT